MIITVFDFLVTECFSIGSVSLIFWLGFVGYKLFFTRFPYILHFARSSWLKKMVKQQIAVETMALSFLLSSFFPLPLFFCNHLAYFSRKGSVKLEDSDRLVSLSSLYGWLLLLTIPDFIFSSNKCHSVKSILFLKTHKTGGSSVANILFRFARGKDLRVALPRSQIFSFYWPWSFQVNFVDNLPSEKPDILCSHARQVK